MGFRELSAGGFLALLLLTSIPGVAVSQATDTHHDDPQLAGLMPAAPVTASSPNRARFQIPAVRVTQAPQIDGVLDDEVWREAFLITDFVQQEPIEGAPATERTEVRVMHDGSTLFIGVHAFDSRPEGVVATEMRRDGARILDEDNFQIILDTFLDSRSAYMFVVSPLGAMLDQQVFLEGVGGRGGNSGNINRDWDGVWNASARRTADGWTAEVAIPMVTLQFPDADTQDWGINFQRSIVRKNEDVYWAPIPRPFAITRISLGGTLREMESLNRGRDLRIKPYTIVGGRSTRNQGDSNRTSRRDVGLDVKYGLPAGLNMDLTLNTDFAQAEADDERVNLTRFALFFPEKRDFFLENAGQFNVGTAASNNRLADLFFSRRIGISDTGEQVPIIAGARVTGKVGAHNVAAMSIQTDDAFGKPGENFLVARHAMDIGTRSQVGAIFVNKQAMRGGDYNRTYGADFVFAPNASFTANGFLAGTSTPGITEGQVGGHFRAGWLDQSWRVYVEYTDLGDNFNADVGFVPRIGIRTYKFHVERTPRPGRWGVRVMEPMWNVTYTTDQTGRLVSRQYHNMFRIVFNSGASLNTWHNRYFDRLDAPFRVAGVTIPAGDYAFNDWRVSFDSNPAGRVTYGVSWEPQTFYGGQRTDVSLRTGIRINSQLATGVQYTRNDVDLPEGEFVAEVGAVQVDYAISPRMSFRGLTQYNSSNEQWSTSARFRYSYRPGSDIYIVYDEERRNLAGIPLPNERRDRQLLVKMTYLLSL